MGGFEGGGDSFGGFGGGGYGSAADYLNSIYGNGGYNDFSGGQGEAQYGTNAYTSGSRYPSSQQGQQPQAQTGQQKQKTGMSKVNPGSSFGQWENLSQLMQGGNGQMLQFPQSGPRRSSDIDYGTFLKFMSEIGPMLFGQNGRGQNPSMP